MMLILGLGNDLRGDDAVGLRVAARLRERLADVDGLEVIETGEMGLGLLDFIAGHRDVLLVDAVQTGRVPPGDLIEVDEEGLRTLPEMSPHFLGVGDVLEVGRLLGLDMPERLRVFAVEAQDVHTVGTELTGAVARGVEAAAERLEPLVRAWATERTLAPARVFPEPRAGARPDGALAGDRGDFFAR